jgi:gamma-glutamylcysteine synthetase
LVKKDNAEKLQSTLSLPIKTMHGSVKQQIANETLFLASMSFEIEAEERLIAEFEELVKSSKLIYSR